MADDDAAQTVRSAIYLLNGAVRPSRDGQQINQLLALRQMADPGLAPLFSRLVQSPDPVLKIHGILGLAECDPERKLDLVRIAALDDPALQAQALSAAMDSKLLTDDQAKLLVEWPGLDLSVRVLVATVLVGKGHPVKAELLDEAIKSDNLARSSLAWLLKLHLGDAAAMQQLEQVHRSSDPTRDRVRQMLLRTALQYNYKAIAPWAMQMATEPGINSRDGLLALKTAMRFGLPEAQEVWKQQFTSTGDAAQQTRLALVALREGAAVRPEMFEPLLASKEEYLRMIGKTGQALAKKIQIAEAAVAMIGMDPPYPLANSWALRYAETDAAEDDSKAILLALILAYENAAAKYRMQLLDDAVSASQILQDRYPESADALLRPILTSDKTDEVLLKGILLGLVRAKTSNPFPLARNLPVYADPTSRSLTLLLQAKLGIKLTAQQLSDLALMVRGGGVRNDSLRVQAAWVYLKLTDQTDTALAEVLGQ